MQKKDLKKMALLGLAAGLALSALPMQGEAGVSAFIAHQCGAGGCGNKDNTPKSTGQDAQGYYVKPGDQTQPTQVNPQQNPKKQDNSNNN